MENFKHLSNIFVVVDPTQMHQPAIEKAEFIALTYERRIHLYCCVYDHAGEGTSEVATQTKERVLSRTKRWLERMALASKHHNVEATVEVEWNRDWVQAAAEAANRYEAQLLVKATYRRSAMRKALLRTSDMRLLRQSPCPALLVKTGQLWKRENRKILLALKAQPREGVYDLLNEWIIEGGHVIGDKGKFEVHAVHTYTAEGIYYDRRALAAQCDLPLEHMHDINAMPHKGIVQIAKDIDADMVMIGTRQNTSGLRIGDTLEKALDALPMDVLVMPAAGFSSS